MSPFSPAPPPAGEPPLVRVLAPDARRLTDEELRALGIRAPHGRHAAFARGRQMVAMRGDDVAGVAAFEMDADELFVHACAVPRETAEALTPLIAALELACLAAGGSAVAVSTHAEVDGGALQDRVMELLREGASA
ncbi:MAG: hypothetical protein ACLGHP_03655, partial [Vicinamibacteria bacterium]